MTEPYPTSGGHLTRGEVFTKILYHIDELRDLCCMMSHLHKTEGGQMDLLLAKGWLGVNEMLAMFRRQVTEMAKGKLQ